MEGEVFQYCSTEIRMAVMYDGLLLDWTMGLRVSEEDEVMGLDLTQHGESGYST